MQIFSDNVCGTQSLCSQEHKRTRDGLFQKDNIPFIYD